MVSDSSDEILRRTACSSRMTEMGRMTVFSFAYAQSDSVFLRMAEMGRMTVLFLR